MGLDIYLYPIAAAEANKRHYSIWEEDENDNYPREHMTDEEVKAHEEANPRVEHEDVNSQEFPEHYYKRTYLRSSYNSSGFNHVVNQILNEDRDLYWIFKPLGRDWAQGDDDRPLTAADVPGLQEARKRALSVAEALEAAEPYAVMTIDAKTWLGASTLTESEALARFLEEKAREMPDDFGWYSNAVGEFFHNKNPPTIYAAIPGVVLLDTPAVHLIYKPSEEGRNWYIQAAKITAEFCDEAIMLIERDGACEISWSG